MCFILTVQKEHNNIMNHIVYHYETFKDYQFTLESRISDSEAYFHDKI